MTEAENEMERLDKEAEEILESDGPESPLLMDLYEVCRTPILRYLCINLFIPRGANYGQPELVLRTQHLNV